MQHCCHLAVKIFRSVSLNSNRLAWTKYREICLAPRPHVRHLLCEPVGTNRCRRKRNGYLTFFLFCFVFFKLHFLLPPPEDNACVPIPLYLPINWSVTERRNDVDPGSHYRREGDANRWGSFAIDQNWVFTAENTGHLQCFPTTAALVLQRKAGKG